ncbi:MAG: radical SAM protein [Candidatus Omnitrophica bacterium]|nr:radical SAM protein [Candidatus Omnitrophota bacterium]
MVELQNGLRWAKKLFIKHNSLPEQVTFFITNRCNLNCQHCFFWKEINQPREELTLNEIEKISKTMGRFAFLSLTGGEPFLRADIADIASIFYKNNRILRLSIPTNGILSKEIVRSTEDILNKNKGLNLIIKIALDGLEKEHDQLRGRKGCFKRAVSTYGELLNLKRNYPNLRLEILTTLCSLNQNRIDHFYRFVSSKLKPDYMGLNLIRGELKDNTLKEVNLDVYQRIYKQILNRYFESRKKRKDYRFHLFYKREVLRLLLKIIQEEKFQTSCYAGVLSAVIYEQGDVYPCELLDRKMGNLRKFDYDFKRLWVSSEAREIKREIRESRCFCRHECNLPINIFFNLKFWGRFLFTPLEIVAKGNRQTPVASYL